MNWLFGPHLANRKEQFFCCWITGAGVVRALRAARARERVHVPRPIQTLRALLRWSA
jgi:hypothetical protein